MIESNHNHSVQVSATHLHLCFLVLTAALKIVVADHLAVARPIGSSGAGVHSDPSTSLESASAGGVDVKPQGHLGHRQRMVADRVA